MVSRVLFIHLFFSLFLSYKAMPDLGNLSLSSSLSLSRYPNLKSPADSPDSALFSYPNLGFDCNWEQSLCLPSSHGAKVSDGTGIRVFRRSRAKKGSCTKLLEDHVSAWVSKKMESGIPESRCSLPFLVGAKKMVPLFFFFFSFLFFFSYLC